MSNVLSSIQSITVIRHGDHKDNVLTEAGRAQADARRFPDGTFDIVIISKQPRTSETAERVAPGVTQVCSLAMYPEEDLVARMIARMKEVDGSLAPALYLEVPEIASELVEFGQTAADTILSICEEMNAKNVLVVNHAPGSNLIADNLASSLHAMVSIHTMMTTNLKPCEGFRVTRDGDVELLTNPVAPPQAN